MLSKTINFYFIAGNYYSFQTYFLKHSVSKILPVSQRFKNSRTIQTGINTENSNLKNKSQIVYPNHLD